MLAISDFEFIISLVIAQKVLSYTEGITSSLQSKSIDIIAAYKHVNVITESLRDVRRNIEQYNKEWYTLAKELAQKVQVEPKIPRLCKRQLNRHNIPAESPEEYYRKNLSIPFVEHLLSELVTRFSLQQQKAINVLYLVPSNAIVQQESQFTLLCKKLLICTRTICLVLCVFKVNYTVGIKSGKTILVFHPAQP